MANPLIEIKYFSLLKNRNAYAYAVDKEKVKLFVKIYNINKREAHAAAQMDLLKSQDSNYGCTASSRTYKRTKWSASFLALLFAFGCLCLMVIAYLNFSYIILPGSEETFEVFGLTLSFAALIRWPMAIAFVISAILFSEQLFKWINQKKIRLLKEKYNIAAGEIENKKQQWQTVMKIISVVLLVGILYSHYIIADSASASRSVIADNSAQNSNFLFGFVSVILPVTLGLLLHEISSKYILIRAYQLKIHHQKRRNSYIKERSLLHLKEREIQRSFKKLTVFKNYLEEKNLKIKPDANRYLLPEIDYLKSYNDFSTHIHTQSATE